MIAALMLLTACERPGLPDLSEGPHVVRADELWRLELDEAHYPTDVLLTDKGELWVLDSDDRVVLRFDAERQPLDSFELPSWTRPSRMVAAEGGGVWMADPLGHVLKMGPDGVLQQTIDTRVDGEDIEPVAILEQGGKLLVSERMGGLLQLDPGTGVLTRTATASPDGAPLRMVTDLAAHPDRGALAVDTLRSAVHHVDGAEVLDTWGRFGTWAGSLMKPKGLSLGPLDTVLVADSALDVVQVFSLEGESFGMLAHSDGQPIRLGHPVAIEPAGRDEFLVLDAEGPTLHRLRLSQAQVGAAVEAARSTHALRYPLRESAEGNYTVAGEQGDTCLQCHDGLVLDDRQVWQKDLQHHPVNIVPDGELPAFFPLDDDGRLQCNTCHSPHGTTDADEASNVASEEDRLHVARHWSEDEFFTRLSRGDSALCEACHTDAAHDDAVARLGLSGSAHPVGSALEKALAARYEGDGALPDKIQKGCLGCHSPHAAQSQALLRASGDGKGCISCHEPHADSSRSHPVGGSGDRPHVSNAAEIPLDRDGQVDCLSCHQLVGGHGKALLRQPADGGQLCLSCHDDRVSMLKGAHARVRGSEGLSCLGCHDVHDQANASLLAIGHGGKSDPNGCLSCHAPGKKHARRGVDPGRLGHPVDGEVHAASGDAPLTCASCHDAHRPEAVDCKSCHQEQAQADDRGGHGKAECLDCHPAHGASPTVREPDHNPRSWSCLACHGASRGTTDAPKVAEFEHPAPVFEPDGTRWEPLGTLPLYAPDGSDQAQGVNGEMACLTCHLVHGPDVGEPKAKLKRPGWEKPCAACHGDNALILYRYFHQPERRKGVDTKSR